MVVEEEIEALPKAAPKKVAPIPKSNGTGRNGSNGKPASNNGKRTPKPSRAKAPAATQASLIHKEAPKPARQSSTKDKVKASKPSSKRASAKPTAAEPALPQQPALLLEEERPAAASKRTKKLATVTSVKPPKK